MTTLERHSRQGDIVFLSHDELGEKSGHVTTNLVFPFRFHAPSRANVTTDRQQISTYQFIELLLTDVRGRVRSSCGRFYG